MSNHLETAIKLAKETEGRFKVAALLFDRKDNLLSIATNSYIKTHPMQKQYAARLGNDKKAFLHAEIAALLKLKKKKAYKVLLVRVNKHGDPLPIDPCPVCTLALKEHGVKIIERILE